MRDGDRSHPQLQQLDALLQSGLTFPGWEEDVKEAEACHMNRPVLFDDKLSSLRLKEAIHTGNRTDERLVALDALATRLTYAGWQEDFREAEQTLTGSFPSSFQHRLEGMENKQKMSNGDRSHPQLRALDALVAQGLAFAGWREDVKKAEERHTCTPVLFDETLRSVGKEP
jgi:hypothetical protein